MIYLLLNNQIYIYIHTYSLVYRLIYIYIFNAWTIWAFPMKVPSNHLGQCDQLQAKARPQKRIVSRHWDWKGSGVNIFFFLDHHRKILWGKTGWCSLLANICIWVKSSYQSSQKRITRSSGSPMGPNSTPIMKWLFGFGLQRWPLQTGAQSFLLQWSLWDYFPPKIFVQKQIEWLWKR